ncbi:hypothetical protein OOZ19_06870 [Saccharopolyspora sp. NFXS83]|nr:hypothetical protein [Saccharopolyspora sp. NFXS83]MCX2729956.1 hypothetical protein [Saccharopolyspora sp. NFXS83]
MRTGRWPRTDLSVRSGRTSRDGDRALRHRFHLTAPRQRTGLERRR